MENEAISIIVSLVNVDGSKYDPPENPLREKWDRLYPPMRYGKPCGIIVGYQADGHPYMNYGCVLCYEEKCPHSNGWKVPDEDLEVYNSWQKEVEEYHKIHNPNLLRDIEKNLTKMIGQESEL